MTPTPSVVRTLLAATATPDDGTAEVIVGDYYYYPQVVTVTVGTLVRWEPIGDLVHTIMPVDPPSVWKGGGTSGAGSPAFEFTFRRIGTYHYYCIYHPGEMDAWIVVIEDS